MRSHLKANLPSYLVVALMAGFSVAMHGALPDRVATHFDPQGNPDGYGPRWLILWLMPVISALIVPVLPLALRLSPSGYQMRNSRGTVARVLLSTVVLLASIHAGLLLTNLDPQRHRLDLYLVLGIAQFMMLFGNVLSKSERNFVLGIRTPWTLVSDDNWRATHRLGARLLVAGGLVALACAPWTAGRLVVAVLALVAATTVPAGYSLWYDVRHPRPVPEASKGAGS